jgi:hypothetical protein
VFMLSRSAGLKKPLARMLNRTSNALRRVAYRLDKPAPRPRWSEGEAQATAINELAARVFHGAEALPIRPEEYSAGITRVLAAQERYQLAAQAAAMEAWAKEHGNAGDGPK